jgi:hypothetical protein
MSCTGKGKQKSKQNVDAMIRRKRKLYT